MTDSPPPGSPSPGAPDMAGHTASPLPADPDDLPAGTTEVSDGEGAGAAAPANAAAPTDEPPAALLPTQGMAIAALVTGITFWPVGLFLGFAALGRIKRTKFLGRRMAIAGLVLSVAGALATIAVVPVAVSTWSTVAAAFADQGATAAAPLPTSSAASPAVPALAPAVPAVVATPTPLATVPAAGSTTTDVDVGRIDASVSLGEAGSTADGITVTVTSVSCGLPSAGTAPTVALPAGQFCLVSVTLTNNGTGTFRFSFTDVVGHTGKKSFPADAAASIYSDTTDALGTNINHDVTVSTSVVFDVPTGSALDRVTFSNGFIGGAVEIKL